MGAPTKQSEGVYHVGPDFGLRKHTLLTLGYCFKMIADRIDEQARSLEVDIKEDQLTR